MSTYKLEDFKVEMKVRTTENYPAHDEVKDCTGEVIGIFPLDCWPIRVNMDFICRFDPSELEIISE